MWEMVSFEASDEGESVTVCPYGYKVKGRIPYVGTFLCSECVHNFEDLFSDGRNFSKDENGKMYVRCDMTKDTTW